MPRRSLPTVRLNTSVADCARTSRAATSVIHMRSGSRTKPMKKLSPDQALSELRRHQSAGHHVDERVRRELNSPGQVFTMTLSTADEFLNLIWQETDSARLFTPTGEPRTLRDVGRRIVD